MAAVLGFGFPEEAVTIRAGTSVLIGPCEADCIVTDRPNGGRTKTCHRLPKTRRGAVGRYKQTSDVDERCLVRDPGSDAAVHSKHSFEVSDGECCTACGVCAV